MTWNWQKKEWPNFKYDKNVLEKYEAEFIHKSGIFLGSIKHINQKDEIDFKINIISDEALKTSEIEGEYLNRDSIRASIAKNFGLEIDHRKIPYAEKGVAELMMDLYRNFKEPISEQSLQKWNSLIIYGDSNIIKNYREHDDPMQIISGSIDNPKIHFEAPPSKIIKQEMKNFINWFNKTGPTSKETLPALIRAGIAHLYFVCLHPFEDGNGRIARALAEKTLSQSLGEASLLALSINIEKQRKKYYEALDFSNKDLEITEWLEYFSKTILEAQDYSQRLIEFIIKKTKFYEKNCGKINERQEKVISRIFKEGPDGFIGGLSAENYISITKTSRATATRDLQDLVDKSIFTKKGELKSTRYALNL